MGGFIKTTCEDYEYLMPCVSSIYTAGPGIDISSDNVISNTGVLSVNGQTGHVIIQAGDVTFSPYPNTFNTTGTTAEFLSSIASLNLPTGSAYLGQVSLSDMPEGVTVQGDVEVYVYPQNVIYAIMRSAEVEPYQRVADSYSNTHYGRGWIPVGNYVVESTTPSVAVEGMLWYDTTNNVVKVYDGTNWNEIGEGETYTAGANITIDANNEISAIDTTYTAGANITIDANNEISATDTTYTAGTGIDITNNEISVDNTVAMASDVNTKTFYLSDTSDLIIAQAAYDWIADGKNAIIDYGGIAYIPSGAGTGYINFTSTSKVDYIPATGGYITPQVATIQITESGGTVTGINASNKSWYGYIPVSGLSGDGFTPTENGHPATKKYVDDGDTYIGSSAPSSPVEGKLWYDTTNDVLKAYDGTNWNSTGGSFSQVQADWNQSTITAVDYIKNKPNLSTVATSGNYNDLSNKPTIPAAQIQSDWNQTNTSSADYIKNKPTIPAAQVQANWNQTTTTAVDYIKNKPTIPTVNNATLTIQKNGSQVGTFTANASSNKTINITVPTKTSDISNDSGYITSSSIPSVGNGTITINQGGTQKGTFTTNQSGNTTINLDAGGGGTIEGSAKIRITEADNNSYAIKEIFTHSGTYPLLMNLDWYATTNRDAFSGHIHIDETGWCSSIAKQYYDGSTTIIGNSGQCGLSNPICSISGSNGGTLLLYIYMDGSALKIRLENQGLGSTLYFDAAIGELYYL